MARTKPQPSLDPPARASSRRPLPGWAAAALVALVPATLDPWGWDRFGPAKWLVAAVVLSVWAVTTARRGVIAHRRALTVPWLVMLTVTAAATLLARDPLLAFLGEGSRLYGLVSLAIVFGAYLAGCSNRPGDTFRVARALVAGGAVVVAYGLVQMAGWDPLHWGANLDVSRARSTLGNAAFLGGCLTLVLPVAGLQWANADEPRRWRQLYGSTFVAGLVVMAGTKTRSAWLGLAVGLGVGAWLSRGVLAGQLRDRGARRTTAALGALVAAVVLVAAGLLTPLGPRALSTLDPSSGTAAGRLDTWADTIRLVRERPVLGWGPEGFRTAFPQVVSRQWVTRYGQEQVQDRAHNELLDTASATGLLGLVAYAGVFVALAFTARDALRKGGIEVAGIVAGLLGYLAHAQFLFDTFDLSLVFWVLAGVLAVEAGELSFWRPPRAVLVATTSALAGTAVVWGSVGVLADRRVSEAMPGSPAAVVSSLAHAAALRPRTLEYYLLAGRVAADSGDQRALRRADALLRSWSDRDVRLSDAGVLTKLGAVTGDSTFVEAAASIYDSIVRREPFAGLVWLGLGEARLRLGQGTEARAALVLAASLLPGSPEPHLALGFLDIAAGRSADANLHLDLARRIAPSDPRVADLAHALEGP